MGNEWIRILNTATTVLDKCVGAGCEHGIASGADDECAIRLGDLLCCAAGSAAIAVQIDPFIGKQYCLLVRSLLCD